MRRKDREITDINKIIDIISRCDSCYLALHGGEYPYIVPMSFGYRYDNDELFLYFHSAKSGTKIELMKNNNHTAFSMSTSHNIILGGGESCRSTMKYESVCGNGDVRFLNSAEKVEALTYLMEQYNKGADHSFDEAAVKMTEVMELKVKNVSGKVNC